jgi:hypothetical protein
LAYRDRRGRDRRAILDEMTADAVEMGMYGQPAPAETDGAAWRMTTIAVLDANVLIPNALLRDFPLAACEPHGVVAEHPDTVLLDLWTREPRTLLRVLGEQATSTGRRGTRLTVHQVLDYLASAGARRFAAAARQNVPPPDDVPALP